MSNPGGVSPRFDRELARWFDLRPVPEQLRLLREQRRFKLVRAGRRSGKTERFKRHVVKEAMRHPGHSYFAAAPTRDQAKRIFWRDLKLLSFASTHRVRPSESELRITLDNEATITVLGLDVPERIEGVVWHGGGIDEISEIRRGAWEENIKPALDTMHPLAPDYSAWCWLFGVPDGRNAFADLCDYAATGSDPEWGLYEWKSAEVLAPEKIDAARRTMSPRQFRQEYEASVETAEGRIYEDYSAKNHTDAVIEPHERLLWCHDFNFTPMSSAICVIRNGRLLILDEIILESANPSQSALEFVERYRGHQNRNLILYGDAAGRAGEKHGQQSAFTAIEHVLRSNGWGYERRVRPQAPAIVARQNAVRAKICNAAGERSLLVNPGRCKYVDRGLLTVTVKAGSSFLEDDRDEFQHITTAIGYLIAHEWPAVASSSSTGPRFFK